MTISAVVPDIAFAGSGGAGTMGPFSLIKSGTPLVFFANSEVVVLRYDSVTDTTPTLLVEGTDYTLTGGPTAGSITLTSPQTGLLTAERLYVTTVAALAQSLDLVNGGNFSSANLERRLDVIFQILQQHAREIKSTIRFAMFDTDEIPKTTPLGAVIDKVPYVTGTAASPTIGYFDADVLDDLSQFTVEALAEIATVAADLAGADTIGIVAADLSGDDDIGTVVDNLAAITTVSTNIVNVNLVGDALDDGTIGDLLEAQISKRDTYAGLTAISAANRTDDMVVYVLGRTADADGGEGFFRFDAASAASANGGTVLAPDAGTGRWIRIRKPVVDPREFGAAGNGSTNDATALQAALTAAAGGILDLMGLTYRCDTALTGVANVKVRNGTLDYSQGLASGQIGVSFAGTLGSADTSLSAVAYTDRTLTVTSNAAYAADDDLLIRCSDVWASVDSSLRGQWVRVKSKTSTTILNLFGSAYDAYTTSRELYKPTLLKNVIFEDVTFIGRGDSYTQYGLRFQYAKNITIRNCTFKDWAYAGLEFYTSRDIKVIGCHFEHGEDALGASYGSAFYHCCENITFVDCSGLDLRHLFTTGGTLGVNRFITVKGCTGIGMTDSFLDAHPPTEFCVFDGNTGEHETAFEGDGIVYQGANGTITNNQIISAYNAGILLQPFAYHNRDSFVVSGNLISRIESATGYGILIDIRSPVRSLVLANNVCLSPIFKGIEFVSNGSNLYNTVISGNSVDGASDRCLYFNIQSTDFMQRVAITGNTFRRANTTGPVIECLAGTEGYLQHLAFTGNGIFGGTYGIDCDAEVERVLIVGNIIRDFATAATELTGVAVTVSTNNLTS